MNKEKIYNIIWKGASGFMFGFTIMSFVVAGFQAKTFFANFGEWSERRKLKEQIAREMIEEQGGQEERDRELERILGITPEEIVEENVLEAPITKEQQ
ncbi:hypothetical protein ABK040_015101 [Willaertia magna]